jgi:DNA-binding response OmpR family regulator
MTNFDRANKSHLALVVSPNDEDHWRLIHILRPAGWGVDSACSCEEAVRSLEIEPARVVIVDRQLPDGNWKTLLNRLTRMPHPPELIVTSRLADERLWAEVLNLGGFDVLSQPFFSSEVLRCVNSAGRHWDEEWRRSNAGAEEILSHTTA